MKMLFFLKQQQLRLNMRTCLKPERAEYGVVQCFKACQKNGAMECFTIQFHGEKRMENI